MSDDACAALAMRVVRDLLEARDDRDVGPAVARRITHLAPDDAVMVAAQALGWFTLLVRELEARYPGVRGTTQEVRDGLLGDLVAARLTHDEGQVG